MDGDLKADQRLKDEVKKFVINSLSITDDELGQGSYGAVRIAMYQGKECVVKEIPRGPSLFEMSIDAEIYLNFEIHRNFFEIQ